MKIILTKDEFMAIRQCVVDADTPAVTEGFNSLFTNAIPEIKVDTVDNTKVLMVDEDLVIDLVGVTDKHSKASGKKVLGFIRSTPSALLSLLPFATDLKKKIAERRNKK